MNLVALFLACIVSGYALTHLPSNVSFISDITGFFNVIGALAMIIFPLVLLYMGVKALFKGV